jgi:hypothetical protein
VAQATTAAAEDAGPAAVEAASTATSGDSNLSELSVEDPTSFLDLGVDPLLLSGLAETGIEVPSPIQEAAIPVLLSGRNAAIQSYTGSGKVRRVGSIWDKVQHMAGQGRACFGPYFQAAVVWTHDVYRQPTPSPECCCCHHPPYVSQTCP